MSRGRLAALWLASFAFFFSFFLLLPTLPLYLRDLGASDGAIGLVMGCFALTSMVLRPWTGWGADRWGRRKLMNLTIFGYAAFSFLTGLSWDAWSFAGFQFVARTGWIDAAGLRVDYHVGIDGLSIWLVMLTTLIMPIALLASYTAITKRVRQYLVLMLILETGMIGVFVSLDLFLFYVFWEAMLIPMYFMIGLWGGGRRIYAAVKFVLYTLVGSLLLGLYDDDGRLDHVGFTSAIPAADKPALTARLEKLVGPPGFTGRAPGGPSRWSSERSRICSSSSSRRVKASRSLPSTRTRSTRVILWARSPPTTPGTRPRRPGRWARAR